MLIEVTCAGEVTRADLKDGVVRVGGGRTDEVRIPGLPAALLTLRIEAERLTVTAKISLSIGRSMFPARLPRLVVAGEVVELGGKISLRQVPRARRNAGTATIMRELMRGELNVEHTRASTLTCLTGSDAGNVIPLAFDVMVLGRGDDCTVQVRDRAVSRRHARLVQREAGMWLEDLRGANGTYVNGQRVLRKTMLQAGDVIELGQTLLRYDAAKTAAKPAPPSPPSVVIDEPLSIDRRVTGKMKSHRPAHPPPPPWLPFAFAGGAVALIAVTAALLCAAT